MQEKALKILKTKDDGTFSEDIHENLKKFWIKEGLKEVRTYKTESNQDGLIKRKTNWIITEFKDGKVL